MLDRMLQGLYIVSDEKMIYLTGDTHGEFHRFNIANFPETICKVLLIGEVHEI